VSGVKMSKRKIIIIAIVCVILAIFVYFGINLLIMNRENKNMNAIETGEFLPGIYAIKDGFVNVFLIKDGQTYIAIDAGMNANNVKQGFDELGILPEEVTVVLLTHTHGDHTGALLKLFDQATVYSVEPRGLNISEKVSDGNFHTIGNFEVQVIATPGHSDDSVCYLFDGKYLFTGDTLSLNGNQVGLFNSVYNKSDEQQKLDIEKLSAIEGVEYIITSHYGFTANPVFP